MSRILGNSRGLVFVLRCLLPPHCCRAASAAVTLPPSCHRRFHCAAPACRRQAAAATAAALLPLPLPLPPLPLGGPVGPLPPIFFSSENSSLADLQNSGGVMVRWHFPNLASPIFDFAPPLNAITIITNLPILVGGYLPPCKMGRQNIAMLEHHKFPG